MYFEEEAYMDDGVLLLDASAATFEVTALVCDPACRDPPAVVRVRWPGMPFGTAEFEVLCPPCYLQVCDIDGAWRFASLLIHFQAQFSWFGSPRSGLRGRTAVEPYETEALGSLERAVAIGASCVCTSALRLALEARGICPSASFLLDVSRNFRGMRNPATAFVKEISQMRTARELYLRARKTMTPGRLPHPLKNLVASYAFFPDRVSP